MNFFRRRSGPFIFITSLLLSAGFGRSELQKPDSLLSGQRRAIEWINNGEKGRLFIHGPEGDSHLNVTQLAEMAQAQLRWQPVTQQVCLSRIDGSLCFNWGRPAILKNGKEVKGDYKLELENDQLFVPLRFATSREFHNFSGAQIVWNEDKKQLIQNSPITLQIPPVEKLSDRYRLTLTMPPSVPHQLIEQNEKNIWIRFVRGRSSGSQVFEGDNVIKEVRVVQHRHAVDLILAMGEGALSNDIYFENGRKQLVIDVLTTAKVAAKGGKSPKATAVLPPVPFPIETASKPSVPSAPQPQKQVKAQKKARSVPKDYAVRKIIIDPGHGGFDCGAIGARGTYEKDINLKVAKLLAQRLKKEKGIEVILTRDTDVFIPLSKRTEIANSSNADLFVSIHCNSSLLPKHSGFEVYLLSPEASDKAAEAVARIENSVLELERENNKSSNRLTELLASMAIYEFINESSRCAGFICRGVRNKSSLDTTSVKEADFYVLRGAQMPSVLIELEYVSHPISELRLRSSRFQDQLVKGITEGILSYQEYMRQGHREVASQYREAVSESRP